MRTMLEANLLGKRALVTGASSGFGAHFARLLARSGAEVIAAARRVPALETLVAKIQAAGGRARAIGLDVSDPSSIAALWDSVGGVDILVNNAGVTLAKPLLEQDTADWDHVVGINLKGAFLMANAAARQMKAAGIQGSIVNIASILGLRQAGQVATYAISKAGLVQMTKVMALELARDRIRVNALCPGYFATDLNREFWETEAGLALIRRVPQRRLGQLEDLDGPMLLLASDASCFMTGSVIEVDGGHLVSSL